MNTAPIESVLARIPEPHRIVITGGPNTGKTTLAEFLNTAHPAITRDGYEVLHTDDLIGTMDWSEASDYVAAFICRPGGWLVEGVAAVRGLRKWFRRAPTKPCDLVVHLSEPLVELTARQAGMLSQTQKIFGDIRPDLLRSGVKIVELGAR